MSMRPWTRRTALVVAVVGVAVVGAAALFAIWLWPDHQSRTVPIDEVLNN